MNSEHCLLLANSLPSCCSCFCSKLSAAALAQQTRAETRVRPMSAAQHLLTPHKADCCCFQDGQVTAQLLLLTVAQQSRAEPRTHLLRLLDVVDYLPQTAFPSLSWAAVYRAALCSNRRMRLARFHFSTDFSGTHLDLWTQPVRIILTRLT